MKKIEATEEEGMEGEWRKIEKEERLKKRKKRARREKEGKIERR